MTSATNEFYTGLNGLTRRVGPADNGERAYHESLVKTDYERCHPGETFGDLKHRARFSKEDMGLLREWMMIAALRAAERENQQAAVPPRVA
ncbi:MAG TPA: hypothetical protein VK181_23370 [Rhizobium sp.]|nr:hypothetical protein [Rhizobium sp.]